MSSSPDEVTVLEGPSELIGATELAGVELAGEVGVALVGVEPEDAIVSHIE